MIHFYLVAPAPSQIYTLSLHDALPISVIHGAEDVLLRDDRVLQHQLAGIRRAPAELVFFRSEEHTSELQSPYDLVCRLLLEKKKNIIEKFTRNNKKN